MEVRLLCEVGKLKGIRDIYLGNYKKEKTNGNRSTARNP